MRILTVDLGNTTLFAGVFADERLVTSFRIPAADAGDPAGFARHVAPRLRGRIDRAALCSVVPARTAGLARAVARACGIAPRVLSARASGLAIAYRPPARLGTDRIACALGARARFPGRDVIVVDCGTATTLTALTRDGVLPGGAILPGLGLWPAMLASRTAQLPLVALRPPAAALGRSTRAGLRSGIVLGHAGAVRELARRIAREAFGPRARPVIVGTGGHAARLARENLFTLVMPDLILTGLRHFAAAPATHA